MAGRKSVLNNVLIFADTDLVKCLYVQLRANRIQIFILLVFLLRQRWKITWEIDTSVVVIKLMIKMFRNTENLGPVHL